MTDTVDIAALIEENITNGKLYIGDDKVRYALGEPGERNIICIGVNPSIADFVKDDPTIEQVKRTAKHNNYDGWIMLNLYPLRATDFEKLNCFPNAELLAKNAEIVKGILNYFSDAPVWAAWGSNIENRGYLKDLLVKNIDEFRKHQCCCQGNYRHPHHPLYIKTAEPLNPFDISEYISGDCFSDSAKALKKSSIRASLFNNVMFFIYAEPSGGNGGNLDFYMKNGQHYNCNYNYGDIDLDKICSCFPAFDEFLDKFEPPEGWEFFYLEMGNHLLIRDEVYKQYVEDYGECDDAEALIRNLLR